MIAHLRIRVYQYLDVENGWTHDRTKYMFAKDAAVADARRVLEESGREGYVTIDPPLELLHRMPLIDWDKTDPEKLRQSKEERVKTTWQMENGARSRRFLSNLRTEDESNYPSEWIS